ncbi:MAG: hypothetical protein ACOYJH_00615 [Anaerovoracaceae bacterium]|jgi:hypothetical protein
MTEKTTKHYFDLRGLLLIMAGMILDAAASAVLEFTSGKWLIYSGYMVSIAASLLYIIGIFIIHTRSEYIRRTKLCIVGMLVLSVLIFLLTVMTYYFNDLTFGSVAAFFAVVLVVVTLMMVFNLLRACADIGEDQGNEDHEIFCNRAWVVYVTVYSISYVVNGIASNVMTDSTNVGLAATIAGIIMKLMIAYICFITYRRFDAKEIRSY